MTNRYTDEEIRMMAKRLLVAREAGDMRYDILRTILSLRSGYSIDAIEIKIEEYAAREPK